jgi:hypothetical protein
MTSTTSLKPLLAARFRASSAYQLILYDRLPSAQQEQLSELAKDDTFYGLLQPSADNQANEKRAKAIDQETALLYLTLRQEPGAIPAYVRRKFGHACNAAIAELVLDGILEIALEPAADFVSGAAAHGLLFQVEGSSASGSTAGHNRLVQLSYEALQVGQRLSLATVGELAARLYRYNTIPLSPAWQQCWPDAPAVAQSLGIQAGGAQRAYLDRYWIATGTGGYESGWLSWRIRSQTQSKRSSVDLPFKLYISPRPEVLADVWPLILEQLAQAGVPAFKIGKAAHGLLRPDKLVAYLPHFAALSATAEVLEKALNGCPAQGVPFTAPIDAAGLLSWGMDPPQNITSFDRERHESWRSWITHQLAAAILEAKMPAAAVEPWQYALDRLQLEGIDTETWVPKQALWQNAGREK